MDMGGGGGGGGERGDHPTSSIPFYLHVYCMESDSFLPTKLFAYSHSMFR